MSEVLTSIVSDVITRTGFWLVELAPLWALLVGLPVLFLILSWVLSLIRSASGGGE